MTRPPTKSPPTKSHGRIAVRPTLTPRPPMEEAEVKDVWTARILTLFPAMFPGPLGESLLGQALKNRLWQMQTIDIRNYARDKHRSVDDKPFGGGAGMVMKPDVVARAIDEAMKPTPMSREDWPLIYLSPRGKPFDQAMAQRFANAKGITMLCGRFEGVDQRVLDAREVEEVSLGDFVMTGGEIAAMALIDATVRLIPRVLGNADSVEEESFAAGLLEAPHYTKPQLWEGREAPEVLLSGHHARIAAWRTSESERLTKERRPDLWRAHVAKATAADPVEDQERSGAQTTADKGGQHKD